MVSKERPKAPPHEAQSGVSTMESPYLPGAPRVPNTQVREVRRGAPTPQLPERFQVLSVLGRGGMGTVYRAYDSVARHEVALKALHGISADDRLRLKHEFRTLRNVVHPNLVTLYELVLDEEFCFFTMELIRGRQLSQHLKEAFERCTTQAERYLLQRTVAEQLALAVHAIHGAGSVHRDIKPSNVLVTEAGRVVLLDFGLSIQTLASVRAFDANELGGTIIYMAPEQLWQNTSSSASDWYSYAVTLFEAVSGRLPPRPELRAPNDQVVRLSERGVDIDPDLDRLIARLLAYRHEDRPDGALVLETFGVSERLSVPYSLPPSRPTALLGRDNLLRELNDTLLRPGTAGPQLVCVSGASGMGKTAVLHSTVKHIAEHRQTFLLRSRCHPQEAVAYNAVDDLIDDLSGAVMSVLRGKERTLTPDQHYALGRVFPVLTTAIELPDAPLAHVPERSDLRHLAVSGIAALLDRVALHAPVLAWIDDAQWGDEDSGVLLRELLRAAKHPAICFVISYRAEGDAQGTFLRVLSEDALVWPQRVSFEVGPLSEQDSLKLLQSELGVNALGHDEQLRSWVNASDGSPFFLGELARCVSQFQFELSEQGALDIANVLTMRTRSLPEVPRNLLEVIAVAGAPLEPSLAIAAAGVSPEARGWLADLERLTIVRTTDVGYRRVEFYHHRLRDAVLASLSSERKRALHAAIARALLAAERPNPLGALEHFEAAEDTDSIRRYVVSAATSALQGLAFERAARLFTRAIELGAPDRARYELYSSLGEALSRTGNGKLAGEAFLKAASELTSSGREQALALKLTQRAAEQFIQTGHFAPGMDALSRVTTTLGIPLPSNQRDALRKASLLRAPRIFFKHKPKLRATPPPQDQLQRFEVLWAANVRLAQVDFALTSYLTARCVKEALKLGHASCIIRALAADATRWLQLPGRIFQNKAREITETIEALCETHGTAADRASVFGNRAMSAFFKGNFPELAVNADRAIEALRSIDGEHQWEENVWETWSLVGLTHQGELRELVTRAERVLEDARRRDDRLMVLNASVGRVSTAWLVKDQPDTLITEADRALTWAPTGYTLQQYQHFISTTEARIYKGAAEEAWCIARDTWKTHESATMLRVRFFRDSLLHVRARAALAYAVLPSIGSAQREALLTEARDLAEKMARHGLAPARGWAELILAAVAVQRLHPEQAREHLTTASALFEKAGMQAYLAAVRYYLATELKPNPTREDSESDAWFRDQGVVSPPRLRRMLAPGF